MTSRRRGIKRIEQTRQPDRFARQVGPHQFLAGGRDIAFGEDEIDHRQHAAQPRLERIAVGHLVGNAGEPDLLLGTDEALAHRVLAHDKGPRHLRRRQGANGSQRQRDLNLGCERGMAAGEDQPQHVVVEHGVVALVGRNVGVEQHFMGQRGLLVAKRDLPANAVDRLVAPDIDQPRPRIGRRFSAWPALQCRRKGLLQYVLGEIEIADEADQRGQRPPRLVAKYFFDFG